MKGHFIYLNFVDEEKEHIFKIDHALIVNIIEIYNDQNLNKKRTRESDALMSSPLKKFKTTETSNQGEEVDNKSLNQDMAKESKKNEVPDCIFLEFPNNFALKLESVSMDQKKNLLAGFLLFTLFLKPPIDDK